METIIDRYAKKYFNQPRCGTGLLTLCLLILFGSSCKKEADPPGTASLIIVNALPASNEVKLNFKSEGHVIYRKSPGIQYKLSLKTALKDFSNPQRLRLFQIPDTTDKDAPLLDLQLNLPLGSIYTLFLTGSLNAPDTLIRKEDLIPFFPAGDSAMAIRFVNLSKESAPVSINIQGLADGSEATSLGYKSLTAFKRYPVSRLLQDYVFEFRDAATGTLLASYTTLGLQQTAPNNWVFRSFTVVLTGKPGGTGSLAPTAFLVGHH